MDIIKLLLRIALTLALFLGLIFGFIILGLNYGHWPASALDKIMQANPVIGIILGFLTLFWMFKALFYQREIIDATLVGCERLARKIV